MPMHVFIWQTGNDTQKRDLIIFFKAQKGQECRKTLRNIKSSLN